MTRIIATDADIAEGLAHLGDVCTVLRGLVPLAGEIPLRRREPGFEGLCGIVVAQQLSVASAGAIWSRFVAGLDPLTPETLLAADDATLGRIGLSRPKMRTLRAVSEAIVEGRLPMERLARADAEEAHELLTAVKGIGPWTADIFLLFCLGHADAFAPGDLALQEAARLAHGLDARPNAAELAAIAERWRPWRGVAARLLWAYYKVAKSREGVTG